MADSGRSALLHWKIRSSRRRWLPPDIAGIAKIQGARLDPPHWRNCIETVCQTLASQFGFVLLDEQVKNPGQNAFGSLRRLSMVGHYGDSGKGLLALDVEPGLERAIPPAEAEANYYATLEEPRMVA